MKPTPLRLALYLFKFVTTKSYLGLLVLLALKGDSHAWVTPDLIEDFCLFASASLSPWLIIIWFLNLGCHRSILVTWSLTAIGTATLQGLYHPEYAWCPIIVACTLNTLVPSPRWSLTNLCLGFLACSIWLDLFPLGYALAILIGL